MGRPKNVYRGKHRYRWIISAVLIVLALLILGAVWLFDYMQKYIVYDKDDLRLVLPFMQGQSGQDPAPDGVTPPPTGNVEAEIVVDEPDYSQLELGAGEGVERIRAKYVSAPNVSAANLLAYASGLAAAGENAMVLELKTEGGFFAYQSAVQIASSYGVNGTEDITQTIATLKEQGIYLAAEISCLRDDALGERYAPLALKNANGGVIAENGARWLDPYNRTVRAYIKEIIAELADMGFDEVILTGLTHPQTGDVAFSQEMSATPSISDSVSAFAVSMSESARELGVHCSGACAASELRAGTGDAIGQDMTLFFRAFDRVYVHTDAANLSGDVYELQTYLGSETEGRIVPVVSGYAPGAGSWAAE